MYAIVFDLVIADLKRHYGERYHRAYSDIRKVMRQNGFLWIQGSTYVTDQSMVSITLEKNVLNRIDWFKKSIRDIRAFKIEDWSNFTAMFRSP